MASKFALVIANTEYTDPGLAQLKAPGQDAKAFVRVLDSPELCGFDDVIIMINEVASRVSETIDYFFSARKPDDLLIMYFSGHGVRDEYGSLYLAVQNTNRARLRSTAIKADFVREAMDQSRSKRQILILDCCNSGAFAQGTKAEVGGSIGTAKAFEGTGYGRVILTASDSTQFAWEGDKVIGADITNSLFTHFLVKGLEGEADTDWDGRITVDELYDYAYEQVVRHTPKQTPGKWSYKQQGEIYLRENLKLDEVKAAPLPVDLVELITHANSGVRKVAVQELIALLDGKHLGLARSAQEKLREIAENDDSLSLRKTAAEALSTRGFEAVSSPPVEKPLPPPQIQKEKVVEKPSAPPAQSQPAKPIDAAAAPGVELPKEKLIEKPSIPPVETRPEKSVEKTLTPPAEVKNEDVVEKPSAPAQKVPQAKQIEAAAAPGVEMYREKKSVETPLELPLQIPQERPIEAPPLPATEPESSPEVIPLSVGEDVNPLSKPAEWKVPFLKMDKRVLSGVLGVTLGIAFLTAAGKLFFDNGAGTRDTVTPTAALSQGAAPIVALVSKSHTPSPTPIGSPTPTMTGTSTLTQTSTPTITPTATRTLAPYFTAKPTAKKKGGGGGGGSSNPTPAPP